MDRYDPSESPDAAEWLELDEQQRSILVEEHHRRARIELPNLTLHATIHVMWRTSSPSMTNPSSVR